MAAANPPDPLASIVYPSNILRSFCFNNNKGGVGKTTLSFFAATEYARLNPTVAVLIVDCCPQANISYLLLGGQQHGEDRAMQLSSQMPPRTVAGYLSSFLGDRANTKLDDYITPVNQANALINDNVYLVCGDPWLDLVSTGASEQAFEHENVTNRYPWKRVIESLRRGIANLAMGTPQTQWVIFVDTNPAFTIYTQIAVAAADEFVIPVNADDSSRAGVRALCSLVYGANPGHVLWDRWSFARQANLNGVRLPVISLLLANRCTNYSGTSSNAFYILGRDVVLALYEEYRSRPDIFNPCFHAQIAQEPSDEAKRDKFAQLYVEDVRDFHTAGQVAAARGQPLTTLTPTTFTRYDVTVAITSSSIGNSKDYVTYIVQALFTRVHAPPVQHQLPFAPPVPNHRAQVFTPIVKAAAAPVAGSQ